jgi:hypothetical protein
MGGVRVVRYADAGFTAECCLLLLLPLRLLRGGVR